MVLKSTKIALFIIKSSVPVSLRLYQITFAKDTDYKIAKDKQNLRTTNFCNHIFLGENQSNILDGLLTLWNITGSRTYLKGGWLSWYSVIKVWRLLICFTEYRYSRSKYKEQTPHCLIPYSLKLGKCTFSWLVDNVHCVHNSVMLVLTETGGVSDVYRATFLNMIAALPVGNFKYLISTYPITSFLRFFLSENIAYYLFNR